jgi:glycosyltransferase involved in cell wall biosynthesis
VTVIHNWCDGEEVQPQRLAGHWLREAWKLEARFLVVYSGNMGYAHEFDTILEAAQRLRDRTDIVFLFIGGGVQRERIEREAGDRGLTNVQFKPYQPREALSQSLGAANVHLVSLLPQLEGLMVPSKFYAIAAAGRPALFIGADDGEIARLIDEQNCGFHVEVGAGEVLADRITALAADPGMAHRQGRAARRLFDERFERRLASDAWQRVLQAAAADVGMAGIGAGP